MHKKSLTKLGLTFILILCILITLNADETAESEIIQDKIEKIKIIDLSLNGEINEKMQIYDFLNPESITLKSFREILEKASADNEVDAVKLNISKLRIGFGKMQEIRRLIGNFRTSNKKVYAYISGGSAIEYLVACACDEIIMVPSSWLMLYGLGTEVMFFKDLFDWAGVKADIIQMGKYKSAGEQFTNREMSPEMEEELNALLDDFYDQMCEIIALSRNIDLDDVKYLIDIGPFSSKEAFENGLIDKIAYTTDFTEKVLLKKREQVVYDSEYSTEEKPDPAQMNLFSMLSMFSQPAKPVKSHEKTAIALVTLEGPIISGSEDDFSIYENVIASDSVLELFDEIEKDEKIKAVVVRINSPGGSATASDIIWNRILELRKKKVVVTSMSDVAASGGYYIAMAGEKIFAHEGTITGSIGVIGGKFVLQELYGKIKINKQIITRGNNAAIFSDYAPYSKGEKSLIKRIMKTTYDDFVSKAANSRLMNYDDVQEAAQGRVWSGKRAQELGLVDNIGGLHEAVSKAKDLASINPEIKCDILYFPKQLTLFDFINKVLAGDMEVSMQKSIGIINLKEINLKNTMMQLFLHEPVITMIPYSINLK